MAQVAMASPWGAILVVLLAWLSASLSISMADETPPKRSASEVQAARRARKIRHMDARLGREFLYGELGCHEESSDSKDSPTFSLSTISDYSPIRGDLSETAAPLGGEAMAFPRFSYNGLCPLYNDLVSVTVLGCFRSFTMFVHAARAGNFDSPRKGWWPQNL